ncbi:MAG: glycoside hydrolase [Saprospiraceae bacterium]|nr:glycoside hydrolase [Saprospiraceae bacterium]
MSKSIFPSLLTIGVLTFSLASSQEIHLDLEDSHSEVFVSGDEGYMCFRIPAIVKATNGDLLAFAEGRKQGCSDTGDIDLVMKRSNDGGLTWGPLKVIWDDGENTCGNPAPVVDEQTGFINLLSTWNLGEDRESEIIDETSTDTRRIYLLQTKDYGKTWTAPSEITNMVKKPEWTWYATGPGSGIQLESGTYAGRLIVACDHIEAKTKMYFSHIIYSDDNGTNWHLGGSSPADQVNECEVAELSDGRLMINMRNYDRTQKTRQIAYSHNGGISWERQHHDSSLIEPVCQASLHKHGKYLLFSNPASTEARVDMTLRISPDDGYNWSSSVSLNKERPAAYSDLVTVGDELIGCLFETGLENPYQFIVFQRVRLSTSPAD